MTETELYRRLLRTVRVATHTALAEYELGETGRLAAAPVAFRALAAKGAGDVIFPEAGVAGSDGLVAARLVRDADGAPEALVLQAQGSAGLTIYAGRAITVSFGPLDPDAEGRFDADGRAVVALAGLGLDEADLMSFSIAFPSAD